MVGLRRLAVAVHVALMAATAAVFADYALAAVWRGVLLTLALLPLALTLPGLAAGNRNALRWLAVALVLYCGLGSVEAIAARTLAAATTFLLALVELALVLSLSRRRGARSRAAAGES